MNRDEAKTVLLTYRPWVPEEEDVPTQEALALARSDPELRAWFRAHSDFQRAIRGALRTATLPESLRRPPQLRGPVLPFPRSVARWGGLAAAILVLSAIVALVWPKATDDASFTVLRGRLVQSVLRGYPMDLVSTNEAELRAFLRERQAPSDYTLRPPLAELPVLGGGIRSWRDTKVAMVCLQARNRRTLFLFVVERSSVVSPPELLQWATVKSCATASWSEGNRSYILAIEASEAGLRGYVPAGTGGDSSAQQGE